MEYAEQLAALTVTDPALGAQVDPYEYSYDLFLPLPDSRWIVFGVS